MELISYIRLLRRRWKILAALTVVGALAGFGFSLLGEDEPRPEEIQTFYAANETLIVRPGETLNLQQTAFFVTAGEVPDRALETLETDDDTPADLVQTIFDNATETLVISAAGDTPEEAARNTAAFSDALLAELQEERQDDYDGQVADVEEEIIRRQTSITELDAELQELNDERVALSVRLAELQGQLANVAAGEGVGAGAEDSANPVVAQLATEIAEVEAQIAAIDSQVAVINIEREADFNALQNAFSTQETLAEQGAPLAPLEKLEVGDPYEIDQTEYNARRRAGELGTATYGTGDGAIPRSAGGGGGVTESLTDNPPLLIAGGGIVGFLFGVLVVVILARLDHRIRTKEEAEEHFGLPVIAEIPAVMKQYRDATEVLVQVEPMSRYAESYRSLRSALVYARMMGETADPASSAAAHPFDHEDIEERGLEVVMVTSPGPGEGKTTTVANLAAALAEQGYEVLAVNCDYRRPRLVHFLRGSDKPREVSATIVDGVSMINHVTVEGTGARPADVVAAQRRVIERARGQFDVVLLDTAPLLATNDANELLPVVDLVLIVGQVGRTTKEMAEKTRELLLRRGAPVIGLALVGVTDTPNAAGYYYYSSSAKEGGRWGKKRGPTGETIERDVAELPAGTNGDGHHDRRDEDEDEDDERSDGEKERTLEDAEPTSRWWRRGG